MKVPNDELRCSFCGESIGTKGGWGMGFYDPDDERRISCPKRECYDKLSDPSTFEDEWERSGLAQI